MRDLGGRADAPGKSKKNNRARDLQARISLPAREIQRYLRSARIAQKVSAKAPAGFFAAKSTTYDPSGAFKKDILKALIFERFCFSVQLYTNWVVAASTRS